MSQDSNLAEQLPMADALLADERADLQEGSVQPRIVSPRERQILRFLLVVLDFFDTACDADEMEKIRTWGKQLQQELPDLSPREIDLFEQADDIMDFKLRAERLGPKLETIKERYKETTEQELEWFFSSNPEDRKKLKSIFLSY